MTRVVNISRNKVFDVYIGRTVKDYANQGFGNPFVGGPRDAAIQDYKWYFHTRIARDRTFKAKVDALKGKTLGCWCKPLPCHGDVIVEYLEGKS